MPNNTPMDPEDEELLNEPGAASEIEMAPGTGAPAPQPVPNAADTQALVQGLTAPADYQVPAGNAPMAPATGVNPAANFKGAPRAPGAAGPNPLTDLGAFDASKAKTDQEAKEIQARANEAAQGKAGVESDIARDQSINSAQEAVERADFTKKWNDNHAALEKHAQDIQEKYMAALEDSKHPPDMWTGKSTLQKMGAVFGMALGVFGSAANGAVGRDTTNVAVAQLQKQMADEHQRQVDYVNGLDKAHLMALTHVRDEDAARQVAQVDLSSQWQAIRQHMIDVGTEKLKARGATDAQIAGDAALNLLKSQQAQENLKLHQDFNDKQVEHALKRAQTAQAYGAADVDRAKAKAFDNGAEVGPTGEPVPNSKTAKAIMAQYVLPHKADAEAAAQRVTLLGQSMEDLKDPNLSYGGAKQILINAFQASGGNPKGRIAVADIKEVMPEMQSIPDELITKILQGGTGKVSDAYRQTVKDVVVPKYNAWKKDYQRKSDDLEKNIPSTPEGKKFFRRQILPDLPAEAAGAGAAALPPGVLPGSTATGQLSGGKPVYKDAQGRLSIPD